MIEDIAEALNVSEGVVIILLIAGILMVLFQIAALIDLIRRKQVAHIPKWAWALIILLVSNGVGALVYFAAGRNPEQDITDALAPEPVGNRADVAVALLYAGAASLPPETPAIQMRGLTKRFGENLALDDVHLTVAPGSVYGFLGPNGAGKSTALNILAGLSHPTSGSASILGRDVVLAGNDVRSMIGYLPDVPGYYGWMTGEEFLRFAGRLFGIESGVLDQRVEALLELAGLTGVTTRIGGYSRGMRQRLGIAQALINAPRVLLLDEPTSALDPVGRKAVLDMISALAGRTTVFFSTHILVDVERVCDTVAILDHGRLIVESPIGELRARGGSHAVVVELASTRDAEHLEQLLDGLPWVGGVVRDEDTLHITVDNLHEAQIAIPALIVSNGLALQRLESGEASLEEVFVELVGGGRT